MKISGVRLLIIFLSSSLVTMSWLNHNNEPLPSVQDCYLDIESLARNSEDFRSKLLTFSLLIERDTPILKALISKLDGLDQYNYEECLRKADYFREPIIRASTAVVDAGEIVLLKNQKDLTPYQRGQIVSVIEDISKTIPRRIMVNKQEQELWIEE